MTRFLIRRFFTMILVALIVSLVVFILAWFQGDPRYMYLDEYTTLKQWEKMGRELGLDRPVVVQYFTWLGNAVRGNLGDSLREHRPVTTAITKRIPATFQLAIAAWTFSVLVGWPLRILEAVKRGSIWDYIGRTFALFGQATPTFWLGILLILISAVKLGWLPSGRNESLMHFILPVFALGWSSCAAQVRLMRSSMLEVPDSEYVKLARAKGISERAVIFKHALRNSLISHDVIVFGAPTRTAVIIAGSTGANVLPSVGHLIRVWRPRQR